ncbi:MAG TPA: carboxypeptidase regulatory-like domain-containing protein [Candidatus Sulfotelmatobacter sp.]|nr:carboxypeptidase regulatory-like domain-containing protein [Candidatus Sulfotelmatobacter sp.]
MRRVSTAVCLLLVLMVITGTYQCAWGQEVTAAIVGTVDDPSGAPIKGAKVVATDKDRGTVYQGETNEAGAYNINRIPVGSYELKVTAQGFQTSVHPAFTLVLNQTARIDVQMKVGQVSETVEVTGAAPILKTESTQVDTVIDANTNDRLPLATRNYVQLTLLAPGSVTPNPDSFNNGDNTASGGRPYINGNREQANNFILDGIDNNQVSDNLVGFTPAPDAIEEFNLITQNAPAEFGNYQGGIVNATIKSGTNAFHGDLWEFFRNDKLNANKWENGFNGPTAALPKDKLRWNMFGGAIGGPIVKNKLFFFFDWQSQRFDHPASTQKVGVFTNAERTGNFGDICTSGFTAGICNDRDSNGNIINQLYDPFVAGHPAFPNNVITEPIDPVAQNLFSSSLYLAPTGPGLENNATYTQVQQFNTNQYDIKIDYNATSNDHVFGRYSHAKQHNPTTRSFALLSGGFSDAPIENLGLDWSHTFSPTLLNDVRVGVNHVRLHNGPTFSSAAATAGTDLGIANANASRPGLLFLNFNPGSGPLTNVGDRWIEQKFQDAVIQASDAVVITHSRHVFHTGFEFWRDRINTFYTGNNGALGEIRFSGLYTENSAGNGGYGGADFYLGLTDLVDKGISGGEWGQRASIFGAYIQDDWRATDRLTVNLGVRYEAHTPWVEEKDRQDNFDLITGQVIAPNCSIVNLGTAPVTCRKGSRGLYNGTYGGKDFQPRIGLAWTPGALGGKSVIRSAFSISSYLEGTGTNLRLPINPPFTPAETRVELPGTTTEQGIITGGSASDPFASALVRVWDPHVQPAITYQWNFTWQQMLTNSMTFQAGYVGQHGIHEMVPTPYLQQRLPGEAGCAGPGVCPSVYFSGNPAFQSDISQISGTASTGSSNYHALQTVLQKRYSSGLQYQVAYTYSRCRTDNSGYYGNWGAQAAPANPYYQNLYDPRADWADCFFDSRNVLSAYAVYEIPFGHGKRWGNQTNPVVNAVAGGWSVNPIVSIHSGFPVALYDFNFAAGDSAGTGSRGLRPDCNAGAGRTFGRKKYFDPSSGAFAGYQWFDPTPYTDPANVFGTCPAQGPVVGPGYANLDLSLQKNFQITERVRVQFRSDFLNAFNHVNLNTPNSALGSTMGVTGTSSSPRVIGFALKLYY